MALNPDVQRKAQAELDAVVGPDRLPEHEDRALLPYVDAIAKESLRWKNVLPFAFLHMASEDIEYNGYFIPAGTAFIPNSWCVTFTCQQTRTSFISRPQGMPPRSRDIS